VSTPLAYEARNVRDRLRDAARDLDRCRQFAHGDAELRAMIDEAISATDIALVRVGAIRHRIASDAMTRAYGSG
jgi:hypothetical protein